MTRTLLGNVPVLPTRVNRGDGRAMNAEEDLIHEMRGEVEDKWRGALTDAYMKVPTAEAIATKALEILSEETDAIEKS